MVLFNEKNELLNNDEVEQLKKDVLSDYEKIKTPSQDEISKGLGDYYRQAHKNDLENYGLMAEIQTVGGDKAFKLIKLGGRILEKKKKAICTILKGKSGST